jgi:hypothetical protein
MPVACATNRSSARIPRTVVPGHLADDASCSDLNRSERNVKFPVEDMPCSAALTATMAGNLIVEPYMWSVSNGEIEW